MSLSQDEFNHLIKLKKKFQDSDAIELGPHPIEWQKKIVSTESKDTFIMDFRRASIEVKKYTFNKRFRTAVVLLRFDSHGRHTNPPGTDEKIFNGPHVHLYREGFEDKWAFPVEELGVKDASSMLDVFNQITNYCNIEKIPNVNQSLF